jgi:hypothetical protein
MTADPAPYSRWRARHTIDELAASHDAATGAVAVLTSSVVLRGSFGTDPTLTQRIAGRRGWPRTVLLAVTTVLTGVFLAWISLRLVQHISATPGVVAFLPGLLLTLALAGTAVRAAHAAGHAMIARTSLAAAMAGAVTWIALWLVLTTRSAPWVAIACGAVLVAAITTGLLTAAHPGGAPSAAVARRTGGISRRVRAEQKRAQRRLRAHIRNWNLAAHQYCAASAGSDAATNAVARILTDDGGPDLDGIDPFDALILTSLHKYRPAPLAASLEAAVQALHEQAVPEEEPPYVR